MERLPIEHKPDTNFDINTPDTGLPEDVYYSDSDLAVSFISTTPPLPDGDQRESDYDLPFPVLAADTHDASDGGYLRETAPWVGSEDAWRSGLDLSKPPAVAQSKSSPLSEAKSLDDSLALTEEEIQTAALSVPPPPVDSTPVTRNTGRAKVVLGAGASFVALLLLVGYAAIGVRDELPPPDIDLRAENQAKDQIIEQLEQRVSHLVSAVPPSTSKERPSVPAARRAQAPSEAAPISSVSSPARPTPSVASIMPLKRSAPRARPVKAPEAASPSKSTSVIWASTDVYDDVEADGITGPATVAGSKGALSASPAPENGTSADDESGAGPATALSNDAEFEGVELPTAINNPYAEPDPVSQPNRLATVLNSAALERPAVGAKSERSTPPSESALSHSQIKVVLTGVVPAVKRCGTGTEGPLRLKIAVSGKTGRVMSAVPVDGSPYNGTPLALCAARAVTLAKFPKFDGGKMIFDYAF